MSPSRNKALPRIVSLAPNVTSILVAIGARRALLGVSRCVRDVAPKWPRCRGWAIAGNWTWPK